MNTSNKRTVLVTGATGGLGTAMCKELFKDGYTVLGNYHTKEKAEKWMVQMKAEGFPNPQAPKTFRPKSQSVERRSPVAFLSRTGACSDSSHAAFGLYRCTRIRISAKLCEST